MKLEDDKEELLELTKEEMKGSAEALAALTSSDLVEDKAWVDMTIQERVDSVQGSLLLRSGEVLDAAMAFQDIDEKDESPPEDWIRLLGYERAWKRFRVAKASWRSGKTAPIGITVARNIYVGIVKAEAQRSAAPQQLNVAVQMNVNVPQFEEVEIEE